jgi:signal transduction histidine kinase
VGAFPAVRELGESFFWVVFAATLLVYQLPRLTVPERAFLAWITVQFVGGQVFWMVISRPEWGGLPSGIWWPTLVADRALFDITNTVVAALWLPTAALFALIVFGRRRRCAPLDRYALAPVVITMAAAALTTGVVWPMYERTTVVVALMLLPVPAAFIHGASRLAHLRTRVSEALEVGADQRTGPSAGPTAALRAVLRDPGLDVAYWSAERQQWVDESGQPRLGPPDDESHVDIPVLRHDGRLTAVVTTLAASPVARREVEAAVRLCGPVIENAALRALVRAQAKAVDDAQARMIRAGVEERRRLEQDLHDGAQQRLLGTLAMLSLARHQMTDADALGLVSRAEEELRASLAELRDLARGLHPGVLDRQGLAPALSEVVDRLAFPVGLRVEVGRLERVTETTIYFVVCEALTNVAKHAGADRAWVAVVPADGGVEIDVRDDGVGGADPAGNGLRGVSDRVVTLGGRFSLSSEDGTGTWLRAWLPCG